MALGHLLPRHMLPALPHPLSNAALQHVCCLRLAAAHPLPRYSSSLQMPTSWLLPAACSSPPPSLATPLAQPTSRASCSSRNRRGAPQNTAAAAWATCTTSCPPPCGSLPHEQPAKRLPAWLAGVAPNPGHRRRTRALCHWQPICIQFTLGQCAPSRRYCRHVRSPCRAATVQQRGPCTVDMHACVVSLPLFSCILCRPRVRRLAMASPAPGPLCGCIDLTVMNDKLPCT